MRRRLLLSIVLLASGCDSLFGAIPVDDEVQVEPPTPPADELEAQLRELGTERAPYMILEGAAMRDEIAEDGARDYSRSLHPGGCYKVLGLGGEGVEDLDVRIYNPNDVLLERDTTQDNRPYLGQMRPICPVESGSFRIQVRMIQGSGPYAVQVYRSI